MKIGGFMITVSLKGLDVCEPVPGPSWSLCRLVSTGTLLFSCTSPMTSCFPLVLLLFPIFRSSSLIFPLSAFLALESFLPAISRPASPALFPLSAKPVLSSLSPSWAASPSLQSLPGVCLLSCSKPLSFPFCQLSPDSLPPSLLSSLSSLLPFPRTSMFYLTSAFPPSPPITHYHRLFSFRLHPPLSVSSPLSLLISSPLPLILILFPPLCVSRQWVSR